MLNSCADQLIENAGKGADIASQRLDELDQACLADAIERDREGTFLLIDAGAGRCGFINRVAEKTQHGRLLAVDLEDFSEFAAPGVEFLQQSLLDTSAIIQSACSILYSQRTIHYLSRGEALHVLQSFRAVMEAGGRLYLSASGLASELADGYAGMRLPVAERHHYLSEAMQEKHGIRQPVCLYSQDELAALVTEAGFEVMDVTQSAFGNVKLRASVQDIPAR